MENTKFELGPFQKEWIKNLKENPNRQTTSCLGSKLGGDYQACCLGEGLVTYHKMMNLPEPFIESNLAHKYKEISDGNSYCYLNASWSLLGLVCEKGSLINKKLPINGKFTSLAEANDGGANWAEIAEYMENNPENIFVKSI